MDSQFITPKFMDLKMNKAYHGGRNQVTRPFRMSSIMLAIYIFTVIALSEVSGPAAQYSKLTGLALTCIFTFEFLLAKRKAICLPIEFGILLLFVLWNFYSMFWTNELFWSSTSVQTLFQLLLFWIVSVNVMVFYGSIIPTCIGLFAGLCWAIFDAIRANDMSINQVTSTRTGSVLVNANAYAVALTLGVLTCLYLYRLSPRFVQRLLLVFIALAVHQIFFFSGSRKGMIGVILAVSLYVAITLTLNGRNSLKHIILFMLAGIFAYFISDWLITHSPFRDRLFGLEDDSSFMTRQSLIDFAVEQWKRSPLVGHGANQFRVLHEAEFGINTYSHSNYFEILVTTGLIGAAIFYSFYAIVMGGYIKAFFTNRATPNDIAWAFTLLIVLLLWDLVMVSSWSKLNWTMFALLVAHKHLILHNAGKIPPE